MARYIIIRTGTFANAKKTGSYQIAKLREDGSYSLLENGDSEFAEVEGFENNWTRHLDECQKWVIVLNEKL